MIKKKKKKRLTNAFFQFKETEARKGARVSLMIKSVFQLLASSLNNWKYLPCISFCITRDDFLKEVAFGVGIEKADGFRQVPSCGGTILKTTFLSVDFRQF